MILDDFGTFFVVPKVKKNPLFNEDRPTNISNGESTQLNSASMGQSLSVSAHITHSVRVNFHSDWYVPNCSQTKPSTSIDQESESTSNWVSYSSFTCLRISCGGLSTSSCQCKVQQGKLRSEVRTPGHERTLSWG